MNYNVTPQLPANGLKVTELFAGGGLMAVGLNAAGYTLTWANDFDKNACKAYAHNIGNHVVCGDVSQIYPDDIPDTDVIAGGPPCQDYSVAGNGEGEEGERGRLVWTYLSIIERKQPKAFVFENVKGLVLKRHRQTFDALLKRFDEIGYNVSWRVVNAWDYGVAQKRERVFIVGIRKDIGFTFEFPEPAAAGYRTQVLRDVIGDLPEPSEFYYVNRGSWGVKLVKSVFGLDDVAPTVKAQNMPFPPGYPGHPQDAHLQNHDPKPLSNTQQSYLDRNPASVAKNRPVEMDEPSRTIPAVMAKGVPYGLFIPDNHVGAVQTKEFGQREKGVGRHPLSTMDDTAYTVAASTTGGKPRRFTVRECLRIQSVPDTYVLPNDISLSAQYRIVGNGVASRVSYLIGVASRVSYLIGVALAEQLRKVTQLNEEVAV